MINQQGEMQEEQEEQEQEEEQEEEIDSEGKWRLETDKEYRRTGYKERNEERHNKRKNKN